MRTTVLTKYPRFVILLLTFVLAYVIFWERDFSPFHNFLISTWYFGTFLSGMLYDYGFTAAPATAVLLILGKEQNIFLAGIIAGLGALSGDLIIFKYIRHSWKKELKSITKHKAVIRLKSHFHTKIPNPLKKYLILAIASFIIASPLPDEIGVAMLAGTLSISTRLFSVVSFLLNTCGIFIILIIGSSI